VSLRMARGIRMLSETEKISFDDLIADKWSTRSELADRILPDLLEATGRYGDELGRQAAQVLSHWDRCANSDSRGALLFLDWVDQPGAVNGDASRGFARAYELHRPLTTPGGLADPQAAVAALEAAARDLIAKCARCTVGNSDAAPARIDRPARERWTEPSRHLQCHRLRACPGWCARGQLRQQLLRRGQLRCACACQGAALVWHQLPAGLAAFE
jgi:hypothetical protein